MLVDAAFLKVENKASRSRESLHVTQLVLTAQNQEGIVGTLELGHDFGN